MTLKRALALGTVAVSLSAALLSAAPLLACEGDTDGDTAANTAPPAKPKAGETTMTVAVDGIHCAGCVGHVRTALSKLTGVSNVTADVEKGIVTVIYDPKRTKEKDIKSALAKAGFPEKVA